MVAGSSGTTSSSRPWAITMPPECWPRWRGRSWMPRPEPGEVLHARLARDRSRPRPDARAALSPGSLYSQLLTSCESRSMQVGGQPQGLADLARRAAPAVGDDVGGHGRAEAAVALVDVLDHRLAPVAARQVEVDVGPLAALLGEEALEEQLHAHRVDRGDAERVAHRAVGRRAAPLHQDVVGAAVLDEVPDDEEVARPGRGGRSGRARARSGAAPSRRAVPCRSGRARPASASCAQEADAASRPGGSG